MEAAKGKPLKVSDPANPPNTTADIYIVSVLAVVEWVGCSGGARCFHEDASGSQARAGAQPKQSEINESQSCAKRCCGKPVEEVGALSLFEFTCMSSDPFAITDDSAPQGVDSVENDFLDDDNLFNESRAVEVPRSSNPVLTVVRSGMEYASIGVHYLKLSLEFLKPVVKGGWIVILAGIVIFAKHDDIYRLFYTHVGSRLGLPAPQSKFTPNKLFRFGN